MRFKIFGAIVLSISLVVVTAIYSLLPNRNLMNMNQRFIVNSDATDLHLFLESRDFIISYENSGRWYIGDSRTIGPVTDPIGEEGVRESCASTKCQIFYAHKTEDVGWAGLSINRLHRIIWAEEKKNIIGIYFENDPWAGRI